MVNADSLQRHRNVGFILISSGFWQVELHRSCYIVGIGVKGRGVKVFKAVLDLQYWCG